MVRCVFRLKAGAPLLLWLAFVLLPGCTSPTLMRVPAIMALPVSPPDVQVAYGADSLQYGELRLPDGPGPHPVVVILHGGCWLAAYDLHLMDAMATELTQKGYATWNLEYRRVGDVAGGWPNTFTDVARGTNYLRELVKAYPLNIDQVVVVGHSAGGHLALWLAGQSQLPDNSAIAVPDPLPLRGVVSLAGITDPLTYLIRKGNGCGASVDELVGGLPEAVTQNYREASPFVMAPLGVPQVLISGKEDGIVPVSHIEPYYEKAKTGGDLVKLVKVGKAGHFEVIAPGSVAWKAVEKAIKSVLGNYPSG